MTQPALNLVPPCLSTGGPDLERVKGKLGPVVLAWCRQKWDWRDMGRSQEFHLKRLVEHVWSTPEGRYCSPSSPGRTLQALRLEGWLDYEVINRSESLYRLTEVK